MKWSNVKLIFFREARDQLRDRRTLFTIAILPMLLYPLLGMVMLQIAQFMREHPTRIRLVGIDQLPADPPLLHDDKFDSELCPPSEAKLIELLLDNSGTPLDEQSFHRQVENDIRAGLYDAAVYFPAQFCHDLAEFRASLAPTPSDLPNSTDRSGEAPLDRTDSRETPSPQIFFNTASDKSRIAHDRIERVLQRWRDSIVRENLRSSRVPIGATQPFQLLQEDVAQENSRRAALWSKVMPFVVLIWALTGAFYPAIDLCAGEKERGTLETLLSSPAERSEIVWGKLLTVMAFSMATSVLNMASMGLTGMMFLKQFATLQSGSDVAFGPPPLASLGWLLVALVPTSAMFSALALAIAAFARSSKEGQYYLMPLLFVTLPLMLLPMLPTSELTLGTSLIPVTGVMMLLRAVIEGQYAQALLFFPPIAGVTAICCLLAIRWAIDQFSNESVLFRESERVGLAAWLRHVARHRGDTPSIPEALLCGVMLLLIRFFAGFFVQSPQEWTQLAVMLVITQVALIATPVLLMAIILTRSPRKTLLLHEPMPITLVAAPLLALLLHPAAQWLSIGVSHLYPISEDTLAQLRPFNQMISNDMPLVWAVVLIALLPAICEELAFRGFILSGLRHMGHKWSAIVLAAVLFGWTHGFLQQQLSATVVGIVIGFLAVQSGSLWPAILFHFCHNVLAVVVGRIDTASIEQYPLLSPCFLRVDGGLVIHWWVAVATSLPAMLLLLWWRRLPYQRTSEETLREALDHQTSNLPQPVSAQSIS